MTAAFVPGGAPVSSASGSTFVSRACSSSAAPAAPAAAGAAAVRCGILDGLDTASQQPYSFSRNILGPFFGQTLAPGDGDMGAEGERDLALNLVYRHVFGNAYIMEEERAELAVEESQFKLGALTMREFVRALGKTSAYKTRFFEGASMYRFTEVNYMHFLGRAPDDHKEIASAMATYHTSGVDACIDALVDSAEYSTVFGEDTIPFLRFRGAYTPCGSFGMQLALKGGWANSDKAMGGAALSGYNGSDGRQMSEYITAHVSPDVDQAPFEALAENTPLKSTAPNWYACPDPALEPAPAFVSASEVAALKENVAALESQYAAAIAARNSSPKDALASFRAMTKDMGAMLERGPSFSAGDPLVINPFSRPMDSASSPLTEGGCKPSDFLRYGFQMEADTVSRLERDLEVAKSKLRVLSKALASSTPMDPAVSVPGAIAGASVSSAVMAEESQPGRVVIKVSAAQKKTSADDAAAAAAAAKDVKKGPGGLPLPSLDSLPSLSSLPDIPSLPNPFAKKD